jgi:hypothetical protein
MRAKKYRSGFEKLSRQYSDTNERYMVAMIAIKENFTGFTKKAGYDQSHPEKLSESQKRQIRRYYNNLSEFVDRGPVYRVKPSELPPEIKKHKNGVDAVMRAAQMQHGRKRSKYIYVRYDGANKPQIAVRNGSPVFVDARTGYMKEFIPAPAMALATDPDGFIRSLSGVTEGANFYRIANGLHEFYYAKDLGSLVNQVKHLQAKYAIGSADSWDKWLTGFFAVYGIKSAEYSAAMLKGKDEFYKRIKAEKKKLARKRK